MEIIPLFTIHQTVEDAPDMRVYTPLEIAGRNIYIREGCYACHSQMIRTLRDEVERYGPYSLAVESKYDHPMLWGSKRTGPDIARMGNKYSDEWHVRHLNNPRDVVPESVMPHYSWLGRTELRYDDLGVHLAALRKVGVPYTDDMIANAKSDAYGQATPDTPFAEGVTKRYGAATNVRAFDGRPGELTETRCPGRLPANSRQADRRRAQTRRGRLTMDHDFTVWFSKSFGLFYLIALSIIIVAYAFWPSNKKRFDEAAQSILGDEDKPHRDQPHRDRHMGPVMAVEERDPHTGYMTTGHEWNGIKELNTPVPRPVYFFLIVTALFSVVYWVLMPAWPLGVTYTKGLLGIDQRTTVNESLAQAALERSAWSKRIEAESFKQIQADPRLMETVRQTGRTLFGDNCAPCHGSNAQGGKAFPEPDDGVMALGRRSRKHRRDDPRRHQLGAPAKPDLANDGVRARSDAQEGRDRRRRDLRAQPFRSRCRERCARGENRGRQGRFRRQLRHLPWRRRQGQSRSRCT